MLIFGLERDLSRLTKLTSFNCVMSHLQVLPPQSVEKLRLCGWIFEGGNWIAFREVGQERVRTILRALHQGLGNPAVWQLHGERRQLVVKDETCFFTKEVLCSVKKNTIHIYA